MNVTVLGAGSLGKLAVNILWSQGHSLAAVYDDVASVLEVDDGYPVDGTLEDALNDGVIDTVVVAVGDVEARRRIFSQFEDTGFEFATLVHPTATVADSATIGDGVIVKEGAIVEPDAEVGDNCLVGNGAIVCHDVRLGDHVRLGPSVTIAGNATIGSRTYLCVGVDVDRTVRIGARSIVASGCTIWEDVEVDSIVKLPARMEKSKREPPADRDT